MIRIKRITNLDRLAEAIPKPKGAVPEFGLPGWKVMPLEHKIPMIPGPEGAYNLTRRKVGRALWITDGPGMDFNLSDPYCRETRFPYEPLHDEHLHEFFSRPANLKLLLKADQITNNMDVRCSLRDYNAYRKYLRKVHADHVKRELKKRNRLFVERRALGFAEGQARKEAERLKEREKFANDRQRSMQERLLQKEQKIQKQKEKARKTARRLKLLRLIRQEERRLINIKRKERTERIQQNYKITTDIARRKMIDVKTDWKRKDKARKKARDKRLMDIEQQKRKIIEDKWRKKQDFQEQDIAKQKVLLQCIDTHRQKFIEDYKEKMSKETERMQRLLADAKLFINCYVKRHLPDGREIVCCKEYFRRDTDKKGVRNNSRNSVQPSSKYTKQRKHKV